MDERGAASATCREPVGRHREHGVELVAAQVTVRPRPSRQREQRVLAVLAARTLRDDLLGEDVERAVLRDDRIQLAASDRAQQRRALDEVVARRRKYASLWRAADRVTRSADALQQRRDAVR